MLAAQFVHGETAEAVLEAMDVDQPQDDDVTGHQTLPSAGQYAGRRRAAVYRAASRVTASTLMRRCAVRISRSPDPLSPPVGPCPQ